eukprot:ANDGO_06602.mRNA.1 hypothetical protein
MADLFGLRRVRSEHHVPSPRCFSSIAYQPNERAVWMHGGYSEPAPQNRPQYFNDLWRLDTETLSWAAVALSSQLPALAFHSSVILDSSLILYGGVANGAPSSCTYLVNLSSLDVSVSDFRSVDGTDSSGSLSSLSTGMTTPSPTVADEKKLKLFRATEIGPSARYGHSAVPHGSDKMAVIGGSSEKEGRIWTFSAKNNAWESSVVNVTQSLHRHFLHRSGMSCVPHPESPHDAVLLFGGYDHGSFRYTKDVLLFDLRTNSLQPLLPGGSISRVGWSFAAAFPQWNQPSRIAVVGGLEPIKLPGSSNNNSMSGSAGAVSGNAYTFPGVQNSAELIDFLVPVYDAQMNAWMMGHPVSRGHRSAEQAQLSRWVSLSKRAGVAVAVVGDERNEKRIKQPSQALLFGGIEQRPNLPLRFSNHLLSFTAVRDSPSFVDTEVDEWVAPSNFLDDLTLASQLGSAASAGRPFVLNSTGPGASATAAPHTSQLAAEGAVLNGSGRSFMPFQNYDEMKFLLNDTRSHCEESVNALKGDVKDLLAKWSDLYKLFGSVADRRLIHDVRADVDRLSVALKELERKREDDRNYVNQQLNALRLQFLPATVQPRAAKRGRDEMS